MTQEEHFAVFRPLWLRITLSVSMLFWVYLVGVTSLGLNPLWQSMVLWVSSLVLGLIVAHAAFSWLEVNGERVTLHLFGFLRRVYDVRDIQQSSIKVWKNDLGTSLLGVTISMKDHVVFPLSLWYDGMSDLANYLMRNVNTTQIR